MKRLIPFILIVFFIGCGDDDKGTGGKVPVAVNIDCINSNPDCEIIPLSVGNYWTWERVYLDTLGDEIKRDTITDAVTRDTVLNDETWYYMSPIWFTNRSDGIYYLDISEGHWFKYPAQVGDQFKPMVEAATKEVVSIDEDVTIGLGLFNCYQYNSSQAFMGPHTNFIAPGIGLIRGESYFYLTDTTFYLGLVRTLIDYDVDPEIVQ